jgi:hypothetical protein
MSNAWNGDGLPPVDCECEVFWYGDWVKSIITAIGDIHVLFRTDVSEYSGYIKDTKFRPIQTQADKEKQDAIEGMAKALRHSENGPQCAEQADYLYRLGYRLPVEQGEVVSAESFLDISCAEPLTDSDWVLYVDRNFIITRKPKP